MFGYAVLVLAGGLGVVGVLVEVWVWVLGLVEVGLVVWGCHVCCGAEIVVVLWAMEIGAV